MRPHASVLHLDLDAFFASVEQRDKPSLRGKPVVVGGTGGRGVVSTASYEARVFGIRSAMSTREARSRCPHAAYLGGRYEVYSRSSRAVMRLLRSVSPLVEPLSLDEAFVDLAAAHPGAGPADLDTETVRAFAEELRARVVEVTGGLTASVGVASSKLVAKIASELDKPDGLVVVPAGTEQELLRPLSVTVIPGVGPATAERLRRVGVQTVADLEAVDLDELVRVVGKAHGHGLHALARAQDDRRVVAERGAKSVSVEGTYEHDLTDRTLMATILTRQAESVAARLARGGLSGRTITIKVRLHDFTTLSRSSTLATPTDRPAVVARTARELLTGLDTTGGVRLLGVGVSGLADWVQDDLFDLFGDDASDRGTPGARGSDHDPEHDPGPEHDEDQDEDQREDGTEDGLALDLGDAHPRRSTDPGPPSSGPGSSRGASWRRLDRAPGDEEPRWRPGMDVEHAEHGRGWVWGAGRGVVTVRFETADTPPGPVRSFRADDPALAPAVLPPEEPEEPEPPQGADEPSG